MVCKKVPLKQEVGMSLQSQIKEMSLLEKIQTMEALWNNLSDNEEEFVSPEWHGSILNERESLVNSGQASYFELAQMKKDIHDAINR